MLDASWWSHLSPETALARVLEGSLKGTLLLLLAALFQVLLRNGPARARCLAWSVALFGLLLLPLSSAVLPSWKLPLLPSIAEWREPSAMESELDVLPDPGSDPSNRRSGAAGSLPPPSSALERAIGPSAFPATGPRPADSTPPVFPDWPRWAMTIWAGGFLVLCLRLLLDLCGLRRFQKRAREPRDREWRAAIRDAARDVGVRRPVRLLLLPGLPTPMTWGSMNPVVLLPRTAETWSADRRRVVLQHELVHLRRHDWLFLVLGRFTCAVYWFNPLVWLAARCLARQREYACDESVVSLGTRPSDYARHLVDIARSLGRNARPAPATALNMASGHSLERRVRALLDPVDPRGLRPARGTIFPTILVAPGLLLWLASWTPWSDPAPARYTEAQAVEFMRDRDWPRAVEALRQVVAERPDLAAAWFDLGYALHHTGDLDAALPAHLQAAATAGKRSVRAAALYNAACVHSLEARPGQAIRLLRLSFRCGYSDLGHLVKDPDFVPLWKEADFLDLLVQRFPGKSSMLVRIAGQRSRASASATLAGS